MEVFRWIIVLAVFGASAEILAETSSVGQRQKTTLDEIFTATSPPIRIEDSQQEKPQWKTQLESWTGTQDDLRNYLLGGSSDGGGDAIVCDSGSETPGVFLADLFWYRNSNQWNEISVRDPEAVVVSVAMILDESFPEKNYQHPWLSDERVSLGWMFLHRYNQLSFRLNRDLTELDDDFIADDSLPEACRKKQVAVQNIPLRQVDMNMNLAFEMPFLDRGFLRVHETLISLRNSPGIDTTSVRDETLLLFQALDNPGASMARLIEKVLTPENIHNSRPPSSWASKTIFENCRSRLLSETPQPGDDEKTAICRRAAAQYRREHHSHDLATSLPTITVWPAQLTCRTYHSLAPVRFGPDPVEFVLTRTHGTGTPSSNDTYEMQPSNGTEPFASSAVHLNTHRRKRSVHDTAHGDFRFTASFDTRSMRINLFLDSYHPLTNEFSGSLQRKARVGGPRSPLDAPWDGFGIICSGDQPQFYLDLQDSFY